MSIHEDVKAHTHFFCFEPRCIQLGGVFNGFEGILGIPMLELSGICGDWGGESTGTLGLELSGAWGRQITRTH